MDMKTSYVDLVDRQISGTRKKEGKTEEGISGFKNLLKDKNQKKQTGAEDQGTEAQAAAAETAMLYMNGKALEVPNEETALSVSGMELFRPQSETTTTAGAVPVNKDSANLLRTISPMQMLHSMNIKDQADGEEDIIAGSNGFVDLFPEKSEKTPGLFLLRGLDIQKAGNQTAMTEALDQSQNADQSVKATALSDESFTEAVVAETGKEAEGLAAAKGSKLSEKENLEKEDKVSENTFGSIQEKNYEPTHVIRTEEDKAVTVTVNESNPEELDAKLSGQILSQIKTGRNNLELQLEPHNLGKILLKVSYEENQVNVSIICSESKTLKLLSHSAAEIGSILEANVERPFHVVVDKQEPDYLQNQQDNRQDRGQDQHQQQQKQADDHAEDFLQKLRLGIFGADSGYTEE